MSITMPCPRCGKSASASDHSAGHAVVCPQCRETFTAAAPPGGTPAGGPHVGRYEVRAELGSGAFGTVYRAYDPQLDREVALKVPQPGVLNTPSRVGRFLREGRTAARLRHPHIVPVYDAGRDGEHYYIASAFVEGRTLADALADEGRFDLRGAAVVARDLAEALAYAHAQGVVHRDVKPANVMIDASGRPHLMDFGLARRQESEEKLTQDGAVLGTPAYMAPEMAEGQGAEAGTGSDQYSLGVLLYELLCGEAPFAGPSEMVLFHAIHTEPPPPRELRRGVPRDLQTICLKAMAKRPQDRYRDCQALADDLRRWLEGEPIWGRQAGLAERAARWCRREPALAGAVAVVLLCLLALAGTASATAHRDAAARAREEQLRKEAEALAHSRDEKNHQLEVAQARVEREAEERGRADERRRSAESEKLRTKENFEKYVGRMLEGQRAFEVGDYDGAVQGFRAAADLLAGTTAAEFAERRHKDALDRKAAPDRERLAQRERDEGRYHRLMAEGKKHREAGQRGAALKAFAAASALARDQQSADAADREWDELERAIADRLREETRERAKSKADMLARLTEVETKLAFYKELSWFGDGVRECKEAEKWFEAIPTAPLDEEARTQRQDGIKRLKDALRELTPREKQARTNYDEALKEARAAQGRKLPAEICDSLWRAAEAAATKKEFLEVWVALKAAIQDVRATKKAGGGPL
jgi:hypothetical protein